MTTWFYFGKIYFMKKYFYQDFPKFKLMKNTKIITSN